MEIRAKTGQEVYVNVVQHALQGRHRMVRQLHTTDAGFITILLESPMNALPVDCGRSLNLNIAAAEAIQLIGGFSSPDLLIRATTNFKEFLNGESFHGAYGARIQHQVVSAINKLQDDAGTRQAIITLWDPSLDNSPGMKDYPCTVALGFEIDYRNKLCMNVFMRSNDVWLGLPYDMFQFTQLQMTVARVLMLRCGWYRHTTLSMHLYEHNAEAASNIHSPLNTSIFCPEGIGFHGQMFTQVMKRARRISANLNLLPDDFSESEKWYADRFTSYMG